MEGDSTLRVKFRVGNYGLRPTLKSALRVLGSHLNVAPEQQRIRGNWRDLDDTEFHDFVRHLVAGGQRMEAIKLICEHRKISITASHHFVDGIEKGKPQPATQLRCNA